LKTKKSDFTDNRILADNQYRLYISEHEDNSGFNLNLCRYFGNRELLQNILATLIVQKEKLEEQLKAL